MYWVLSPLSGNARWPLRCLDGEASEDSRGWPLALSYSGTPTSEVPWRQSARTGLRLVCCGARNSASEGVEPHDLTDCGVQEPDDQAPRLGTVRFCQYPHHCGAGRTLRVCP